MARAARVREFRRRAFERPSLRPVAIPNVVEKIVDPPIQEMFEKVAEAQGITAAQLSEAIRLFLIDDCVKPQTKLRIADIQGSVCAKADISREELLGQCRSKNIVKPRHVAMALCKRLTLHSLPEIGRAFGDRDHTTILSATRKLELLTDFVSQNIRPDAAVGEWVEMMFANYGRLSTPRQ